MLYLILLDLLFKSVITSEKRIDCGFWNKTGVATCLPLPRVCNVFSAFECFHVFSACMPRVLYFWPTQRVCHVLSASGPRNVVATCTTYIPRVCRVFSTDGSPQRVYNVFVQWNTYKNILLAHTSLYLEIVKDRVLILISTTEEKSRRGHVEKTHGNTWVGKHLAYTWKTRDSGKQVVVENAWKHVFCVRTRSLCTTQESL